MLSTGVGLSTCSLENTHDTMVVAAGCGEDRPMTFMPYNTTPDDDIPGPDNAISLGSAPGLLITAVPALLGFRPRSSLVLVGMREEDRSRRVGPVVRLDLDGAALREAVHALERALAGCEEPSVVAMVIDPESWPLSGGVDDLLGAAEDRLARFGIPVTETLLIDEIQAGRRWRAVQRHGAEGRWWCLRQGMLGAAEDNPVRSTLQPGEFDGSLSAEEFAGLLGQADAVPRAIPTLPDSWRTGVGGTTGVAGDGLIGDGDTEPSTVVLCSLLMEVAAVVDPRVGETAAETAAETPGPADIPVGCGADLEMARAEVRRRLADPVLAQVVFDMCMSPELFPALVVLGLGSGSVAVEALLLEVVSLAGPVLRHRALALIAVLGVCGRNGALGLQAARLCLAGGDTDDPGVLRGAEELLADEFLTMVVAEATSTSLAQQIVTGMCDGSAAPMVIDILEAGSRRLEDGLSGEPGVAAAVDRAAVSAVRTALARRAGT